MKGTLTAPQTGIEQTFQELVVRWRADTRVWSSVTKMVLHPAYQRIIGLGSPAVPLLLRELERAPDHWFWALRAITGEDPAAAESTFDAAAAAWLRWGRERDLLG